MVIWRKNESLYELISTVWKIFREISVEKREIWSHRKKISSNQFTIRLFTEKLDFTEFLLKISETKISLIPNYHNFREIKSFIS